jgi:hypothetical protein
LNLVDRLIQQGQLIGCRAAGQQGYVSNKQRRLDD